ncbi:MAG TPA: molybdopterin-binding protein, partial [Actinomycetes bacterium]
AAALTARSDLPPWPTSAMDGWAVRGQGPWRVVGTVLAGSRPQPLGAGTAVRIATGAGLPPGADAVLRREDGTEDADTLTGPRPPAETDVRPAAGECRVGDEVAAAGTTVTPALLGLAAAAGYDRLPVVVPPRVQALVLGDELLDDGVARHGQVRDALGPMLPGWLAALGAEACTPQRVPDTAEALAAALAAADADVVVTTGSTARGPVDHLHAVLAQVGARVLVDGVAVRPGHPMLLARLPDGRPLVGLPGNPLAAVSGLLTLAEPVLCGLLRRLEPEPVLTTLRETVTGHPHDTRLVPVRGGVPLHHVGPAMLRGLVTADAMAVIPPHGGLAGSDVRLLRLPGA